MFLQNIPLSFIAIVLSFIITTIELFFLLIQRTEAPYSFNSPANMKALIVSICCCLCIENVEAQTDTVSIMWGNRSHMTLPVDMKISSRQFNMNRLHHSFSLAVPVAAVGFAMMPADHAISRRVREGMPNFGTSADDYLRFVPLATQLTMSLSGVKGRSNSRWQVLATDAMATAMMGAMVYGMKYTVDRTRPNGERGSFPSGHTATAFMGATLLAHEYGHKSVWIPIAGYSIATATGVLRILNNKHYASDVLVGAAIGIVSAELAYWATDAIFNDRKLFKSRRARIHYEALKNY